MRPLLALYVGFPLPIYGTLVVLLLAYMSRFLPYGMRVASSSLLQLHPQLEEAAAVSGATWWVRFRVVVFPLLRPVMITTVVVQSVTIFNDFTNPLYFLPGEENATVQLTLFNFQSQFNTTYNLLFMDILLITIPPLPVPTRGRDAR